MAKLLLIRFNFNLFCLIQILIILFPKWRHVLRYSSLILWNQVLPSKVYQLRTHIRAEISGSGAGLGGEGLISDECNLWASALFCALSNCLSKAKCLLLASFSAADEDAAGDLALEEGFLAFCLPLCLAGVGDLDLWEWEWLRSAIVITRVTRKCKSPKMLNGNKEPPKPAKWL